MSEDLANYQAAVATTPSDKPSCTMFGRKMKKIVPIETEPVELDLPVESSDEEEAISLEDLGNAYAKAVEAIAPPPPEVDEGQSNASPLKAFAGDDDGFDEDTLDAPEVGETDNVPISTESVLEAILFLGSSDNKPIDAVKLQELFRNIPLEEIEECVSRLNRKYRIQRRAFEIIKEKAGYKLQLAPSMAYVRERFYGKVKETHLPQAAIDCLALVAYTPGITREEIEHLWGQPPNSTLNMLVRKGLLSVEKIEDKLSYFTTSRFLEVVGIDSIDDLPHEDV